MSVWASSATYLEATRRSRRILAADQSEMRFSQSVNSPAMVQGSKVTSCTDEIACFTDARHALTAALKAEAPPLLYRQAFPMRSGLP